MKRKNKFLRICLAISAFALAFPSFASLGPLFQSIFNVADAASKVEIEPVAEYYFKSNDVGYETNQKHNFTSVGSPSGTGTDTSKGAVTFNGTNQGLAAAGKNADDSAKNPMFIYATSDITVAFNIKLNQFTGNWEFPMTLFNGGDLWNLTKGHVGFVVDPDGNLRYWDIANGDNPGDWWIGTPLFQINAGTDYSIALSIVKQGNTKIYLDGNETPIYNKPTVFKTYNQAGADWSMFQLGGFNWTAGSWTLGSGGTGYCHVSFSYLNIYNFACTSSQAAEYYLEKALYKTTYNIKYNVNGGEIKDTSYPISYVNGDEVFLPTHVSRSGFVFAGWFDNESLSGSPITSIGVEETGNKEFWAKWTTVETWDGQLTPDYYYEFLNSANPGLDSSGKASLATYGNVTCSNGIASFDGSSCLYADSESKDFGQLLSSYTIGFDITLDSVVSGGWQVPMTFGNNNSKWLHFAFRDNSTELRFSNYATKAKGQADPWWAYVVDTLDLNKTYRLTLSVEPGGKCSVYLDGVLKLSIDIPEDFSMNANDLTFCIGGQYDYNYKQFNNGFRGKISNFDVYTFAANSKECVQDGCNKAIDYKNYSIEYVTNGGEYTPGYTVPNSYKSRVGVTLPTSNNISMDGFVFKGWYNNPSFSGSAISSISNKETGNKKFYAKFIDSTLNIEPIAKYDFSDPSNPGKDTYGNFNLTNKGASVSNGKLVVGNGNVIYGYGSNNFLSSYDDFTISFDVLFKDLGGGNWIIPLSFGNNGTQSMLFNMNPGNLHYLRFKMRDGDKFIAGSGNDALWGDELGYVPEWMSTNIVITVKSPTATVAGKIAIYLDGAVALSRNIPVGFNLPKNGYFSIGGLFDGSSTQNPVNAEFDNIKIYDFAATATEVNYLINHDSPITGFRINYDIGDFGYTSGPILALVNENITINTYPNEDYAVDTFTVNGKNVSPTSTNVYNYKVTSECDVAVTFKKINFNLGYQIAGPGSVKFYKTGTSEEISKAPVGSSVTIVAEPSSGCEVISFKVNGDVKTLDQGKFVIDAVDDDISVIAAFDTIKATHNITYHENGGEWTGEPISSYTETIGCVLPGGVDIVREGYEFAGWYDNSDLLGDKILFISETDTKDFELWASWQACDYSISYNFLEDGVIKPGYPTGYTYGVGVTLPTEVYRNGYTFVGWYDNYSLEGDPILCVSDKDIGNKDFFAKWQKDNYSIHYNNIDGATWTPGYVKPESYQLGDEIILPTSSNITKVGYTLEGWYLDSEFKGDKITFIGSEEVGNKNLFAKWIANTYDVFFNPNGGYINESYESSYTFGVEYVLPTDVTRDGYSFAGWYDNPTFTGEPITSIVPGTVDSKTFIAKWTPNSYSINYFDKNGDAFSGEHEDAYPLTFKYDEKTFLDTPTRPGYEFGGYFLTEECEFGTSIYVINENEYCDNLNLYALWIQEGESTISYFVNGGVILEAGYPTSYNPGTSVTLPSNVSKTGYEFNGWYDNKEFTGDPITEISATESGSKTFYAKWTPISYSITYYDGPTSFVPTGAITEFTYGTFFILPTNVSKAGTVFVGWYNNADFLGEKILYLNNDDLGDKEYFAKFEPIVNYYSIIFESNDGTGSIKTTQVTSGVEVDLSDFVFIYDYFNQISWCDASGNTYELSTYIDLANCGETLVLYAVREPKQYEIAFVLNDGTFDPSYIVPTHYVYGTELILPSSANLSKEGYTFGGWYSNDDFSSGSVIKIYVGEFGNKAYYAKWISNGGEETSTYGVSFNTNGGKIVSGNFSFYKEGDTKVLPTDMYMKGYAFGGWFDNESFEGNPILRITPTDTGDKKFFAKWNEQRFNVVVSTDGHGTASSSANSGLYSSSISVSANAFTGYELDKIYVNGVELIEDANGNYIFVIEGDSYVDVTFKHIRFAVNIEEVEHGYVDTFESSVEYGEVIEIIIRASKGYTLDKIMCNGVDMKNYVVCADYIDEDDYVYDVLYYRVVDLDPDAVSGRNQLTIEASFVKASGCNSAISTQIYIIIPLLVGLISLSTLKLITKKEDEKIIRNKSNKNN